MMVNCLRAHVRLCWDKYFNGTVDKAEVINAKLCKTVSHHIFSCMKIHYVNVIQ